MFLGIKQELMVVFYWSCLFDKYGFFDGWEQCLQTQQIFRLQVAGLMSQFIRCLSIYHLQRFYRHGEYGDDHAIRHHTTAFSYKPKCVRHGYVGACHGSLTTTLIHGYTVHCDKVNIMYLLATPISYWFRFISPMWWGSIVHLQSVKQR